MSIQLTCSHCQAKLQTDESKAGSRAKCPKCGGVIEIPSAASDGVLDAEITGPLAGFAEEELTVEPPVARAGGDVERKPCPMCGEMIVRDAVKCRFCGELLDKSMRGVLGGPGDASDPGWKKVRGGLSLLYNCIGIVFATAILMGIAVAVISASGGRNADESPAFIAALGIGGLTILGASIGMIVGQVRCASVPESSGARGFATAAAACILGNIVLSFVSGAAQIPALSLVSSLVSLIGVICFIMFIRRSADYLGNMDLARGAGNFLMFGVAMFVGIFVLGFLAAAAGGGAAVGIGGLVFFVMAIVGFIWYLRLIKALITTIDQQT